MAKINQVVEEEEIEIEVEVPEVEETKEEVTPEVSELSAYDKHGNLVRTFSREVHGDDFAEKAKEFAQKGYTIR